MTAFLAEIGTKLADRWAAALVVPGLLWTGVLTVAVLLGNGRALDARGLLAQVTSDAAAIQKHGTADIIAVAVVALLLSCGAGLAASLLAAIIQRFALGEWWPAPLAGWRRSRRDENWRAAAGSYADAVQDGADAATVARLADARNRISKAPPASPTWMGDQMAAVVARVRSEYGLDLPSAWSRLWLIVPAQVRGEITASQTAFGSALGLCGWAVLYLVVVPLWWPAAFVVAACAATGWIRARSAMRVLADLVESTVDLHGPALAAWFGFAGPHAALAPQAGMRISRLVRKGA